LEPPESSDRREKTCPIDPACPGHSSRSLSSGAFTYSGIHA
jgi:hypothetical protein